MALSRVDLTSGAQLPRNRVGSRFHRVQISIRNLDIANLRVPMCSCCAEVFRVCVTHALTTEVEEVMGLLLGDVMVS